MSFRVLVIPEDPTHNGYILKPLVERVLRECGKPNAQVEVLTNPWAKGYEHAKGLLINDVLDRYRHFDLLLFLPDRDGRVRDGEFSSLETTAASCGVRLLCCAAVEEVEAWLLAGHTDKLAAPWSEVRHNPSVKEQVFEPFLATHGDARRPGGGRDLLMKETLGNYAGLLARCPELAELQSRIQKAVG